MKSKPFHHSPPRTRRRQTLAALRDKIRRIDRVAQAQLTTRLLQKDSPLKFRIRAINGTFILVYLEGKTRAVKIVICSTQEVMRLGAAERLIRILRYWNPRLPKKLMKGLVPDHSP